MSDEDFPVQFDHAVPARSKQLKKKPPLKPGQRRQRPDNEEIIISFNTEPEFKKVEPDPDPKLKDLRDLKSDFEIEPTPKKTPLNPEETEYSLSNIQNKSQPKKPSSTKKPTPPSIKPTKTEPDPPKPKSKPTSPKPKIPTPTALSPSESQIAPGEGLNKLTSSLYIQDSQSCIPPGHPMNPQDKSNQILNSKLDHIMEQLHVIPQIISKQAQLASQIQMMVDFFNVERGKKFQGGGRARGKGGRKGGKKGDDEGVQWENVIEGRRKRKQAQPKKVGQMPPHDPVKLEQAIVAEEKNRLDEIEQKIQVAKGISEKGKIDAYCKSPRDLVLDVKSESKEYIQKHENDDELDNLLNEELEYQRAQAEEVKGKVVKQEVEPDGEVDPAKPEPVVATPCIRVIEESSDDSEADMKVVDFDSDSDKGKSKHSSQVGSQEAPQGIKLEEQLNSQEAPPPSIEPTTKVKSPKRAVKQDVTDPEVDYFYNIVRNEVKSEKEEQLQKMGKIRQERQKTLVMEESKKLQAKLPNVPNLSEVPKSKSRSSSEESQNADQY